MVVQEVLFPQLGPRFNRGRSQIGHDYFREIACAIISLDYGLHNDFACLLVSHKLIHCVYSVTYVMCSFIRCLFSLLAVGGRNGVDGVVVRECSHLFVEYFGVEAVEERFVAEAH